MLFYQGSVITLYQKYSLRNLRRRYFRIQLWTFATSFSPVVAIIRRAQALIRRYLSGYFSLLNVLAYFIHWTLPHFLFLVEIPLGTEWNHLKRTSLFVFPPTFRRLGSRVRWSFSLPFGFTSRSYTRHTRVPPFFILCAVS